MKKGGFVLILLLAGMMFPRLGLAVSVEARADRTAMGRHESVYLTVKITGGDGTVDVSAIEDFKVISSGSSSSVNIINGAMTRESSNNYVLTPVRTGTLIIPELQVDVDGEIHKTGAIAIEVSETPDQAGRTEEVFMEIEASSKTPFVGQPFTYTVKIYHALRIANANFQAPEFSGFEAKKVENDKSYSSLSGARQYNIIELNYVLIPVKPGEMTIEPPVLSCDVVQRSRTRGRGAIFDDPFFSANRLEPLTLSGDSVHISARPLPPYQGEDPFSGLVGGFALKAETDRPEALVGDSITLSVTLSGTGNILDAGDPEIKVPEAFKVYKDSPAEQIHFSETGYSGKKSFRTALVPVKPGNFTLPPVKICYFDVVGEEYRILETRPLVLKISPSKDKENLIQAGPDQQPKPGFEKKEVEFIGRDILPLKEDADALSARRSLSIMGFILAMLVPAACFGAARIYGKFVNKPVDDKTWMARRAALSLKSAEKQGVSEEHLQGALYTALVCAVLSRSGLRGESLTGPEMREILTRTGHSPEICEAAVDLLNRIEAARFGGKILDESGKKELLLDVKSMIRRFV